MKYKLFLDYDNLPFRFVSNSNQPLRFKRRFGETVIDEDKALYPDPDSQCMHICWKFTKNVAITENAVPIIEKLYVYDTF